MLYIDNIYISLGNEYQMEEKPALRVENGYTLAEVVVNLNQGFGSMRGNCSLVQDCQKYERGVWLRRIGQDGKADCKSILQSLFAATIKGGRLQIIVEGEDEKARVQALRIYSALISEDTYNMKFDMFEKR